MRISKTEMKMQIVMTTVKLLVPKISNWPTSPGLIHRNVFVTPNVIHDLTVYS